MYRLPLLLALSGCFYVDDRRFLDEVQDADGDGGVGDRFDGPDCVDDNPAIADCDVDGDGYLTTAAGGDDCDDLDAAVVPGTFWFHDVDGDGFGDPDDFTTACGAPPPGWSLADTDCDDGNASVNPTADERCDPLDRNCDGDPIGSSDDATVYVFVDADEDGYGDDGTTHYLVCAPGRGEALQAGDCDDAAPTISPGDDEIFYDGVDQDCNAQNEFDADEDGDDSSKHGGTDCDDARDDVFPDAQEVCDGVDNDCDGLIDADDPDQSATELFTFHLDADGDGFGGDVTGKYCIGGAAKDYVLSGTDCNDTSDAMFPGAVEWCNDVDDNCNGVTDEGTAVDAFTAYFDNDQDGWGGQGLTVCEIAPVDYDGDAQIDTLTLRGGDCGNNDPDVHPGADELCGDSIRQDCTAADPDDCDSDGFLANDPQDPDCDDDPASGGSAAYPGAKETCDGLDNDCDGKVDGDDPDVTTTSFPDWYLDSDHDGHGSPVQVASKTCSPPANAAPAADDCDDLRSAVYPGAPERCDGIDNDCNTAIDDDPVDLALQYEDLDSDGFGAQYSEERCAGEPGWADLPGDCDDSDVLVSPAEDELCADLIDNDCDNLVDGSDPSVAADELWYPDDDKDGFGFGVGLAACGDPTTPQQTYVPVAGDCDDADPVERGPSLWFGDLDADTHAGTLDVRYGCEPSGPTVWLPTADDCNDSNVDVHPGAVDSCNFRDDDCDGTLDNNPALTDPGLRASYVDADADNWGAGTPTYSCFDSSGTSQPGDCDDANKLRNPDQPEDCGDTIDNDCDGVVNDGCTIVQPQCADWRWPDVDGDTFGSMADDPVQDCTAAKYPDDCNDGSGGGGSQFAQFNASQAASVVSTANTSACATIELQPGTYLLPGPINVGPNNRVSIVGADPNNPPVLVAPSFGRVVDAMNSGSTLILQDLRMQGPTSMPDLVHTGPNTRVLLVNTIVDGQANVGGIYAQGGTLGLYRVRLDHLNGPGTEGSALNVDASTAQLTVNELDVLECNSGPAASSVYIDAANGRVLDKVRMYKSKPLSFHDGTGSTTVKLTDFQSWDAQGVGLKVLGPANYDLTRVLIARATGRGIDGPGTTGQYKLEQATLVRNGAAGLNVGGFLTARYVLALENGGTFDLAALDGTVDRSYVEALGVTLSDGVTNAIGLAPQFVTYHAALPTLPPPALESWDLHLRQGSPGEATLPQFAEDAGAFSVTDLYYEDVIGGPNGIPDGWELKWLNGRATTTGDADSDGVTDDIEYSRMTCPTLADTDGDFVNDLADTAPLDPNLP